MVQNYNMKPGPEYDESMKISNQLVFPLYTCARATSKYYRPYMDEMGLTYPQYLTMLVLWEEKEINMKALGERLYLDSGTLTPMMKRLEEKGYVQRKRLPSDERQLILHVTEAGERLKEEIYPIVMRMREHPPPTPEKGQQLKALLLEVMENYEILFRKRS